MPNTFQVVVLGCTGGPREGNLSSYLLSPLDHPEWIGLDAGTLIEGIERAIQKKSLGEVPFSNSDLIAEAEMLIHHLKGFLISHAHLDHIAGLVLNSQIDTEKDILGIDSTIDNLRDHIFNGRVWPNYGSEGAAPVLHKYRYGRLALHRTQPIPGTAMTVEPYLLSHPGGYPSTAFLISYKGDYILYCGDTSPDALETEKHLERIWKRIAPLIREGRLKGMMLECSYSQKEVDQIIYGHLDSRHMMIEMHRLADTAQTSLKGLNVVVTHRKEGIKKGENPLKDIAQELRSLNDLGINFIFPSQGERILL